MSERSDIDGRYWDPLGARTRYGLPEVGWLIAFQHQAWRIVEVGTNEGDPDHPVAIRLRPAQLATHPDPVKAKSGDRHFCAARYTGWNVYPDPEHYPVCSACGEPMPCRSEVGRRMAEAAVKRMGRYETPGVCPACEKPVTGRQKAISFDDNLHAIGGPPVTFHLRGRCWQSAYDYEKQWAAAKPGRTCTLSCPGDLTNHNDGTYECTSATTCPGPVAYHVSMSTCRCPSCHAVPYAFGCRPAANAQLRRPGEAPAAATLFEDRPGHGGRP